MQADGKEPRLGKGYTLDIDQFAKLWYSHPDSELGVSITPFVPFVRHIENTGIRVHFQAFLKQDLASPDFFQQADLGSNCFMVGYPAGYWDRKSLLPVTRQSRFASLPSLDYGVRHQVLLDSPCYSGWLGAPIVHNDDGSLKLLGMLSNSGLRPSPEQEDTEIVDKASMSVMLKSDAIIETIKGYLKEKGFI
jgi:hypothetical protein